jgi:hypothetical protein
MNGNESNVFSAIVLVIFVGSVVVAIATRPKTRPGVLAKWSSTLQCVLLAVAVAVFRFGDPLAGTIYVQAARYLALVLLPLSAVCLGVAYKREERGFLTVVALVVIVAAAACWMAQ